MVVVVVKNPSTANMAAGESELQCVYDSALL